MIDRLYMFSYGGNIMKQLTFEDYMSPILMILSDGKTKENTDIREAIVKQLKLEGEILEERSKNGHLKYADNINFALSYLYMAGLLTKPSRGRFKISHKGLEISNKQLKRIDSNYLKSLSEEFKERLEGGLSSKDADQPNPKLDELNPNELIERGEELIRLSVKAEILSSLLVSSPSFFEKVVVDLIVAMGYGYDKQSGYVVGQSHDGGIDGTIWEDKLGLSKIHLQAKRFKVGNAVGRPEIQRFVGALQNTKKGIFITTSKFSAEAIDYANKQSEKSISLIDSDKLLNLMYEYNIGVSDERTIVIKTFDSDYFSELR